MVPLREENRIFVKYGLEAILNAKHPGLSVLKDEAGVQSVMDVRSLVFKVIPRINAPGRLGYAEEALEILLCETLEEARRSARILANRNEERRAIEDSVYREARELARRQLDEKNRSALVVASEGWHRGILGIVASRLVRDFSRPAVVVSFEGTQGKGSVRTVEDLEILDALASCGACLEGFGGHQMAAGLTLRHDRLREFQESFDAAIVRKAGRTGPFTPNLFLDVWLEAAGELTERAMTEIEQMAPFGNGNAEAVIGMGKTRILEKRLVGKEHVKLVLARDGKRFDAIGFWMGRQGIVESEHPLWDIAFTPCREIWNGRSRTTLRLHDMQPSG
jgi:single-stranded-DNA-specific exonuclease